MKKATKIRIVVLAFLLIVVLALTVTTVVLDLQSGFTGSRIRNPDCYTLDFRRMNQTDSHTLTVHEGDVLTVEFDIRSGRVDLTIGIDGEPTIYRGNDIRTGAFDVTVPQDGVYRVTVDAKRAAGSILVSVNGARPQ